MKTILIEARSAEDTAIRLKGGKTLREETPERGAKPALYAIEDLENLEGGWVEAATPLEAVKCYLEGMIWDFIDPRTGASVSYTTTLRWRAYDPEAIRRKAKPDPETLHPDPDDLGLTPLDEGIAVVSIHPPIPPEWKCSALPEETGVFACPESRIALERKLVTPSKAPQSVQIPQEVWRSRSH